MTVKNNNFNNWPVRKEGKRKLNCWEISVLAREIHEEENLTETGLLHLIDAEAHAEHLEDFSLFLKRQSMGLPQEFENL